MTSMKRILATLTLASTFGCSRSTLPFEALGPRAGSRDFASSTGYLYFTRLRRSGPFRRRLTGGNAGGIGDMNSYGIALDSKQNVYSATNGNEGCEPAIVVYDSSLHTVERRFSLDVGYCVVAIATDQSDRLYVHERTLDYGDSAQIEVFAPGGSRPVRTIVESTISLYNVVAMAVDSKNLLYVLSTTPNYPELSFLAVYGSDAKGTKPPLRILEGSATGFNQPTQLAVGEDGNVYITNRLKHDYDMLVFPTSAKGNVAPLWTLQSGIYGLSIALGPGGEIYLAPGRAQTNGGIAIFAPGASGDATPTGYVGPPFTSEFDEPNQLVLQQPW